MHVSFGKTSADINGLEVGRLEIDNHTQTYTNLAMDHTAAFAVATASTVRITLHGLHVVGAESVALLRTIALSNQAGIFNMTFSDGIKLQGNFIIKKYELLEEYDNFQQFSIQMLSAGKVYIL